MQNQLNEHDIIAEAKKGDRKAFCQLLLKYAKEIFNLCYRLSGERTEAEDLSQTAFLKAFESIGKFNEKSSFSTWVHRIAVNLWTDTVRRRELVKIYSIDGQVESDEGENITKEIADNALIPEKSMEKKELEEAIKKSLDALSPEQRIAIVLKYIENKSLEEIAKTCNTSIGTVSSRLTRGIREIRKHIVKHSE